MVLLRTGKKLSLSVSHCECTFSFAPFPGISFGFLLHGKKTVLFEKFSEISYSLLQDTQQEIEKKNSEKFNILDQNANQMRSFREFHSKWDCFFPCDAKATDPVHLTSNSILSRFFLLLLLLMLLPTSLPVGREVIVFGKVFFCEFCEVANRKCTEKEKHSF